MDSNHLNPRCFWGRKIFLDYLWLCEWWRKIEYILSGTLLELLDGDGSNLISTVEHGSFFLHFFEFVGFKLPCFIHDVVGNEIKQGEYEGETQENEGSDDQTEGYDWLLHPVLVADCVVGQIAKSSTVQYDENEEEGEEGFVFADFLLESHAGGAVVGGVEVEENLFLADLALNSVGKDLLLLFFLLAPVDPFQPLPVAGIVDIFDASLALAGCEEGVAWCLLLVEADSAFLLFGLGWLSICVGGVYAGLDGGLNHECIFVAFGPSTGGSDGVVASIIFNSLQHFI